MHSRRFKTVLAAGFAIKFRLYQNWPVFVFEKNIFPVNFPGCSGLYMSSYVSELFKSWMPIN